MADSSLWAGRKSSSSGHRKLQRSFLNSYEDDPDFVLAKQMGYQGAFTLFRQLFVKEIRNVNPNQDGLRDKGYWMTRQEADGSTTVVTLGQRVEPAILSAYRKSSSISYPSKSLQNGYVPFKQQPTGRHYAM
jgi:beta-fructofuranosidase